MARRSFRSTIAVRQKALAARADLRSAGVQRQSDSAGVARLAASSTIAFSSPD